MLTDNRIHYFQFCIVTFKCHMCSNTKATFQEWAHHIIPMFLENQKKQYFFSQQNLTRHLT
jgi:hypothetical protein